MGIIMDYFNKWEKKYDEWRKRKMDEIDNEDYQKRRKIVEEGEKQGKSEKEIQKELIEYDMEHGGEYVLKQITRIAIIIIVGLIGILALFQLLQIDVRKMIP